jgi:capsular exopolysaccharide synthesis family protein
MAFLLHHLDNSIKSEADIRQITELPILGHVPAAQPLRLVRSGVRPADSSKGQNPDLASHVDARSSVAESFKGLRTSLLLASPEHPARSILVTSSQPQDGKTLVSLNLAIVLTQLDREVLIVDADLRRPRVHRVLGLDNETGLSSLLSGNASLDGVLRETEIPKLYAIPAGPIPPNPSELLGSPIFAGLLDRLVREGKIDHVIVDSPPLLSVSDSLILASHLEGTILVVKAGQTARESLAEAMARLRQSRVPVIGAVLNAVSEEGHRYYYGRYYGRDATRGRRLGTRAHAANLGVQSRRTPAR